jgi:hypothetical protein
MTDAAGGRDPMVQELLDKQAIREALDRYSRGIDRLDAELVTSAFHDDGIDDRGSMGTSRGAAIAAGVFASMEKSTVATMHHNTNVTIELDGHVAGVETYTFGIHVQVVRGEKRRLLTAKRYLDRFERRDGVWRIAHRRSISEMSRSMPLDGESENRGQVGARDRTDLSYEVLGL